MFALILQKEYMEILSRGVFMNHKVKSLFIVIILWASLIEAQEPKKNIILPFTGLEFDESHLKKFKNKNVNEIIDMLRSTYHIHVLILDRGNHEHPANPLLKRENLSDELIAAKYYSKKAMEWKHLTFSGLTLPPYAYPDIMEDAEKLSTDRPFLDEYVMLLTPDANESLVVHEFIHYLIHEARIIKTKKVQDKTGSIHRVHIKFALALETVEKLNILKNNEHHREIILNRKRAGENISEREISVSNEAVYLAWIQYIEAEIELRLLCLGEEMDNHRYAMEKTLENDPDFPSFGKTALACSLRFLSEYVLSMARFTASVENDAVCKEMLSLNLRGQLPCAIKDRFEAFQGRFKEMVERIKAMGNWGLEAEAKISALNHKKR